MQRRLTTSYRLCCRLLIPVYMSQRIYTKKRDEPGALENAIKFWIISTVLYPLDILESLALGIFSDLHGYPYVMYMIGKSALYVWLFWNNFHYSKVIYDGIVPKLLPALEPTLDFVIGQASRGFSYLLTNVTPVVAKSLGAQMSTLALYLAEQVVHKLVFQAASTEPARLAPVIQTNQQSGLTTSFIVDKPAEENERLLTDGGVQDLNKTQIVMPGKDGKPEHVERDMKEAKMFQRETAI